MSLSYDTKLDLDSIITSLLLEELKSKSLDKHTSSLGELALVYEGSSSRLRKLNNGGVTPYFLVRGQTKVLCYNLEIIHWTAIIQTFLKRIST